MGYFGLSLTLFGWLVTLHNSSSVCTCQATTWRSSMSLFRGLARSTTTRSCPSRGWVLFSGVLSQVRLAMVPHSSLCYNSLLQWWFKTRCESVIHLGHSSIVSLPSLPLSWSPVPRPWVDQAAILSAFSTIRPS